MDPSVVGETSEAVVEIDVSLDRFRNESLSHSREVFVIEESVVERRMSSLRQHSAVAS